MSSNQNNHTSLGINNRYEAFWLTIVVAWLAVVVAGWMGYINISGDTALSGVSVIIIGMMMTVLWNGQKQRGRAQ